MRKNRDSKWELSWVRRCDRSQANQEEVLDDCCHVTSVLKALRSGSKDHIIIIALEFFLTLKLLLLYNFTFLSLVLY